MWSHHFLVALRALRRDAGYALLNGVGLAVALTCCVLIGLFVRSELSFDRFHEDADQIVVLATEHQFGQEMSTSTSTPYPLHRALREQAPAVEKAAMTSNSASAQDIVLPDGSVTEADVLVASRGFFDVVDFPALAGDPDAAMGQPGQAVVTASTAQRLFGTEQAVGQSFVAERSRDTLNLSVAAVVADPPTRSSIQFEVVASALSLPGEVRQDNWAASMWMTYARLAPGATPADLDRQLAVISDEVHSVPGEDYDVPRYFATPLPDFHLSELSRTSGFLGDARYLALFSGAAGLVLLLGFINYVNLATARAARRAREIGVREALGAGRGAVALQFLVEAVVLTVLAAIAAFVLAALVLPLFNSGFETELTLADLDAPFVLSGLAFAVLVGLAAGAYPALVLTRFDPAVVLRGGASRSGRPSKNVLRRALVAVQFAVAIGLIACTAVVLRQVAYSTSADLGIDAETVVAVPLQPQRGQAVSADALLDALRQRPHLAGTTVADEYPTKMRMQYTAPIRDDVEDFAMDNFFSVFPATVEPGYIDVLGIELVAGRDVRTDDEAIVNRAFVKAKGWERPEDALGKTVDMGDGGSTVVGVASDYHFDSMRSEVAPVILVGEGILYDGGPPSTVLVRLSDGQAGAGLGELRQAWAGLNTDQPFEPVFLDSELAEMYESERRLAGVLGGFALVALVVACLGLVGLAAYTAQRRTKEIGVRRALGATVPQIVALLSREYAVLVAVGAVVAVPAAVLLLGRWLDGFAYHIDLGPGLFAAAVALTLAVALAVVGLQAARAARISPTRALRTD